MKELSTFQRTVSLSLKGLALTRLRGKVPDGLLAQRQLRLGCLIRKPTHTYFQAVVLHTQMKRKRCSCCGCLRHFSAFYLFCWARIWPSLRLSWSLFPRHNLCGWHQLGWWISPPLWLAAQLCCSLQSLFLSHYFWDSSVPFAPLPHSPSDHPPLWLIAHCCCPWCHKPMPSLAWQWCYLRSLTLAFTDVCSAYHLWSYVLRGEFCTQIPWLDTGDLCEETLLPCWLIFSTDMQPPSIFKSSLLIRIFATPINLDIGHWDAHIHMVML